MAGGRRDRPSRGRAFVVSGLSLALACVAVGGAATTAAGGSSTPVDLDQVAGAAFPTTTHWVELVDQCSACAGMTGGTHTEWSAVTDDAGRHWTFRKTPMPLTVGDDLSTVMMASRRVGWYANGWLTLDGGRRWKQASAPLPNIEDVELAGSRVWGLAFDSSSQVTRVLVGRAGDRNLTLAPRQPFATGYYAGTVIAPSEATVYVQAEGPKGAVFEVTRNAAESWKRLAAPCGARRPGQVRAPLDDLTAFSPDRLVLLCGKKTTSPARLTTFLSFSTDGGRHWTHVPVPRDEEVAIEPVTATAGWGVNGEGQILRTTDGGRSWQTVWAFGPGGAHGTLEDLAASGPSKAFATFAVERSGRTEFLIRRTTDAGASWHPVASFALSR